MMASDRTSNSKKVLVVNQYALPLTSSGMTRHVELFAQLPADWSTLIVAGDRDYVTGDRLTDTSVDGFKFVRIPQYARGRFAARVVGWIAYAAQTVLAGVTVRNLSVVYGSSPHLLNGLAALIVARVRRVPFVLEIRDLWPESLIEFGFVQRGSRLHRALMLLEKMLYHFADAVVPVADGWRAYLNDHGVSSECIVVVTNGADPDQFAPRPAGNRSIKEMLGCPPDTAVAVYAGSLGPPNGIEHILSAAAELPSVIFTIIGDGASKPALVAAAKSSGLDNVRFLDPVPKPDLAKFLWTADMGIHSMADMELFKRGMSPNKLYDYMAAHLPIVTNAGGLAADLVESTADCGAATAPDDIAGGVRRILSLDEGDRRRLGQSGARWLRENASREVMGRRLHEVLELALTQPKHRNRRGRRA